MTTATSEEVSPALEDETRGKKLKGIKRSKSKREKANCFNTFISKPTTTANLKRVAIIVNPMSGGKRGLAILEHIKPILARGGASIQILYTDYAGHARQLAFEADLRELDCLCAIGGDGTAHELVNGFLARPETDEARGRVVIGIFPGGSGNTVAYDLKIKSPEHAAHQLLAGYVSETDVIKVSALCGNAAGTDPATHNQYPNVSYAINMIGWGLSASVLRTANKLRFCGGAQYNLAAYMQLIKNRAYKCEIDCIDADGKQVQLSGNYVMVQAQSTVHMGDRMPFCPDAKLDDGLIDIAIVKHTGRMKLISLMERAKAGKHVEHPSVECIQCKSFTLTPAKGEQAAGELTVNVDGELIGYSPLEATVLPKSIRFVTGIR